MNKKAKILFLTLLISIVAFSCKELDLKRQMLIKTIEVTNITSDGATVKGEIIDLGEGMTDHGVYYSTSSNAQNGSKSSLSKPAGTGTFTATLTQLIDDTKYYARAYAYDGNVFVYGDEITFKTLVGGAAPIAAFKSNETNITEGQAVTFTDQSTNEPTNWNWSFGDGGSSYAQNPTHSFKSKGSYTITLTASNSKGTDTETKTNYITVNVAGTAPVAAFTAYKIEITEGETITFTDQSTNTPTAWAWTFGDGGTATNQYPTHTYYSNGTYTVSLTVSNNFGTGNATRNNYITVNAISSVYDYNGVPSDSYSSYLEEYFSDSSDIFNEYVNSEGLYSITIADGYYKIENFNDSSAYYIRSNYSGVSESDDFEIEYEAYIGNYTNQYSSGTFWGGGTVTDYYNRYYLNHIPSGLYSVGGVVDNSYSRWLEYTSGANPAWANNKFTIRKIDNTYYYFVNESFVFEHVVESFFGTDFGFLIGSGISMFVDYYTIKTISSGTAKIKRPLKKLEKPTIVKLNMDAGV